jgi:hypothetical protein
MLFTITHARLITLKGVYERIRTKFSIKNAKQSQFLCIFHPEMKITLKNKANSNPIQTQTNPIMNQKSGGQSQFKPKQSQFKEFFEEKNNEHISRYKKTEFGFYSYMCYYIKEPQKIAFVTRTSEIFSGKAEGQNRRRHSQSYVEDTFWPDNVAGANCSRSQ